MKYALLALATICAFTITGHAEAAGATGLDLAKTCEHPKGADVQQCSLFIAGVVGGMAEGQRLAQNDQTICPPAGVLSEQIVLIVQKFLRDHPEYLNENAYDIVAQAMYNTYPCR